MYIKTNSAPKAETNHIEDAIPTSASSNNPLIVSSEKGVANGIAGLDANGFVPSSQLPSYVDDVLEYASVSAFPATGTTGKIYVALDTNRTYRWSGSAYVEISESLAIGTTSSTAFAGDRGLAIENKIPTSASASNKLATVSDIPASQVITVDCNTITQTGFYSFGGGSSSLALHYPIQSSGTLLVYNASAFITQTYYPNGDAGADMYMRSSVNGGASWLAWAKFNHEVSSSIMFDSILPKYTLGTSFKIAAYAPALVFYVNQSYGAGVAIIFHNGTTVYPVDLYNTFTTEYTASVGVNQAEITITATHGNTLRMTIIGMLNSY